MCLGYGGQGRTTADLVEYERSIERVGDAFGGWYGFIPRSEWDADYAKADCTGESNDSIGAERDEDDSALPLFVQWQESEDEKHD